MKPITQEWVDKAEEDWEVVDYRYPGAAATKADAQEAIKSCRRVRKVIRTSFGLPV
jgi:hypothetical protein